jgi:hypothetical protein
MQRIQHSMFAVLVALSVCAGAAIARVTNPSAEPVFSTVTRGGATVARRLESPNAARARARATPRAEVIRAMHAGSEGTYIDEIFTGQDSSFARWGTRKDDPIRVWVDRNPGLKGWRQDFLREVYHAFNEWEQAGAPVRFTYVADSTDAEVKVQWVDSFDEPISGNTRWSRNSNFRIVEARISLALRRHTGDALGTSAIRAMALHEIGHMLGLDHTADDSNIMTPLVRVKGLSDADRATVRLLYTLPAGPLR